jgi:hypothetical protein
LGVSAAADEASNACNRVFSGRVLVRLCFAANEKACLFEVRSRGSDAKQSPMAKIEQRIEVA